MTQYQLPKYHPPISMVESMADSQPDNFSFRDLISKLFLRPKTFLFALFVPAIVSVLLSSLVPTDWAASTKILIRYSNADSGILKDLVADSRSSLSGTTSAELIKSLPVLENTIRNVGITGDDIYQKPMDIIKDRLSQFLAPIFGKEKNTPFHSESDVDPNLVAAFKNSLNSSSKKSKSGNAIEILEKNSQSGDVNKIDELISLQVQSFNREKVAPMANGLAQAFIDDFYRMNAEEASKQSEYLGTLVAKQVEELRMVENATPDDFASGRISASGRELVSRDIPIIMTMATQLNEVESELTKASQIYASDSPQVQRLRSQLSKLKFLLKKQERIEMSKQFLEQLKTKQYQAQNTENIYKNRLIPISIVEMATEPPPSSAKKIVRLIVTGIVGLVLGAMLAISLMIILNILDPRIHFRREIEHLVNVPVISFVPKITVDFGEFKLKHFRNLRNHQGIKDGFFQVISKVGHRGEHNEGKVITITGPASGDGATFSALALSLNLAKNKSTKVCLIDANFNNSMISTLFATNEQHGLIDGLIASQSLTKYQTNVSFNFSVIGAGSTLNRNQLGFYTDTAKKQIDELRKLFDYIVIDTGATLRDNEVMVFGSFAEETIMIASSGITRKGMLQAAINKLQSNGNKVTGIIFNQTKNIIPNFIYRMF